MRPRYGELNCKYNEMKIILKNIPPSLKDQFGESPMMEDYINAGLNEIERELKSNKTVKAAFFIDGGPRGNIIDAIFQLEDLYKSFYPTVILCEAHRKFYSSTLKKRSNGRFVKGSNITINHQQVYDEPKLDDKVSEFWYGKKYISIAELSEKEIWYYKKK
jgi:hypothetical protein